MILVVGSTGYLGGEITRRLRDRGLPVRALVRPTSNRAAVKHLIELGAEPAEGDLREPESLRRAVQGATAVVSTATVTRSRQPGETLESTDQQGQANLIDAAREAKLDHFVFVSVSGQIGSADPLTMAKRDNEARLRKSGIGYTILRPSYFMESWLGPHLGFDYPNRRATIYGDGSAPISWIALGDVAEFAVLSLTGSSARNQILELGGPEALSPNQVVRLFEQASGDRFDVQYVPVSALEAQRAGAKDSMEQAFASLMLAYAKGDSISMEATLARHPVSLTSVEDYAGRVLAESRRADHAIRH
ncbi:MAG TPA: SDR family oxidoreductase [Gemmatimonadales bacterium]|nr:SDR family oxidoreductase [Gemmatimonadales bacterium]